jgi:hypothetical protein
MKKVGLESSRGGIAGSPVRLRQGGLLAAGSIAASAFTTLCSLAATVLILRVLPREEAGTFAFLVELLYAVGLLGSLGQPILQSRMYLQAGDGHFDWVRDFRSTILTTGPVLAAGVVAITVPYGLTMWQALLIILGAELFVVTSCFAAVLVQQRHYVWSSALVRLGNGLLIIPAVLMLVIPSLRRLDFVMVSLVLFLGSVAVLGAILLSRWLKRGQFHITLRQRIAGLVFLAFLFALVVPQRGLLVVAGAMLNPATVASLAALVSILRVFDLVGDSAGRVFSTEAARNSERISAGLFAGPWLLAALLAAALLFILPSVVHQFYGGRYDMALPLLPWLLTAAALRLVEVVPRGFIAYRASQRLLHQFALVQCAAAIIGIVLMMTGASRLGVKGLVVAAALIAALRLAISYSFLFPLRKGVAVSAASKDIGVEPVEIGGEETPV